MWNCPCESLCRTCGVSPSAACHKICAPATGAPVALPTLPASPPGFCLGTLGVCACAPADKNAAAHTRIAIFRRERCIAVRLPGNTFSQFYIEEFESEHLPGRNEAEMTLGAELRLVSVGFKLLTLRSASFEFVS